MFEKKSIIFFLLLIAVTITYFSSLNNSFHYDDSHMIIENESLHSLQNIPKFFYDKSSYSGKNIGTGNYRPLLFVSYALSYKLGDGKPSAFIAGNLVLHLLTGIALLYLLTEIFGNLKPAFYAAVLFLLTPFNSEAVNYVTGRSSILYSLFLIISLYFFVRYRKYSKNKYLNYSLFLLFALASFLSKETAVVIPLFMASFDFFLGRENPNYKFKQYIFAYIPFFLVLFLFFLLRKLMLGGFLNIDIIGMFKKIGGVTLLLKMAGEYLQYIIFPAGLHIDHDIAFFEGWTFKLIFILSLPPLLLLTAGFLKDKIIWFLTFWFYLAMLPLFLLPFLTDVAIFQENRGYLSSAGIFAIMGYLLARIKPERTAQVCLTVTALLFSMGTYARCAVWKDEITLWTDAVKKSPHYYKSYEILGINYTRNEDYDKALDIYKTAAKNMVKPFDYYDIMLRISDVYEKKNDPNMAEKYIWQALEVKEKNKLALNNVSNFELYIKIGNNYFFKHQYEEALNYYKKAEPFYTRVSTNAAAERSVRFLKGIVNLRLNRPADALIEFKKETELNPANYQSRYYYGLTLKMLGKHNDAENEFKTIIFQNPGFASAYYQLGLMKHDKGDLKEAEDYYTQTIKLDPKTVNVYNNLGNIKKLNGLYQEARKLYENALALDPINVEARFNYAGLLVLMNNKKEAAEQYQAFLDLPVKPDNLAKIAKENLDSLTKK